MNASRKRLLIVGLGDVARRALPYLAPAFDIRTATRSGGEDLDRPETLDGLEPAESILHSAPPPEGEGDSRTAHLLAALDKHGILPTRLVYISTSGVYGNCAGAYVEESRPVQPQTARARRRVAAEQMLGTWCASRGVSLVVLRAPGIYAADRLPLHRLRAGTPVLREQDDVYTNHIHAEDLAACCARALQASAPPGTYNVSDDSEMKMGEWFDFLADRSGLPRPPRVSRHEAPGRIPEALLSFMGESRRLVNTSMKQILGFQLKYPTVREGLDERVAGVH